MRLYTFGKDEFAEIAYERKMIIDKHVSKRNSNENFFLMMSGYHLKAMQEFGL